MCYKKSLAKRLLDNNYLQEAEREVIKLLKQEKGVSYTQKMETMFLDIKSSQEFLETFNKELPIEFETKTLTACSWPITNLKTSIQIPKEIQTCVDTFTSYYMAKF